jgi:acyl-CoA thioesterase I
LVACKDDLPAEHDTPIVGEPTPQPQVPDTLAYLALGDSYTIGESVSTAERWPVQLVNAVNERDTSVVLTGPHIIAQTGWTTGNLLNALSLQANQDLSADVVSLLIGVNNQYQNLDTAQYRAQLKTLIEFGLETVNGQTSRMFIVSIPDYGFTPFGQSNQSEISTELEIFNAICMQEALLAEVPFYNITPISQQWPGTPNLVAADGLHPSGMQYTLWVESFLDDVIGQLVAY